MKNIFGTYKLTNKLEFSTALENALSVGYRAFDCAELYKNQHMIGDFFREKKVDRSKIWITSKLSFRVIPKGEKRIRESIEATIKEFEYIDLLLIHAPPEKEKEHKTKNDSLLVHGPAEKEDKTKNDVIAWEIMCEYKALGFIKHVGISNYNVIELNGLWSFVQKE
jgi:glycerol 2-dehydrogenase (NADP+)